MKKVLVLALIGLVFVIWCVPVLGAAIPPHRAVEVPGVHAYTDWPSVAAGETMNLRVSSSEPYQLQIVRLGSDIDGPSRDQVLASFSGSPSPQLIYPGSYVHVERGLDASKPLTALGLECWVRPWRTDVWQGLITQYNDGSGVALMLSPNGRLALYLGERLFEADGVRVEEWQHIIASWDGDQVAFWLNGRLAGEWRFNGNIRPANAPLRLGASGVNGRADQFLDGDLAMPVIYSTGLSPRDIVARLEARALRAPTGEDLFACWPLSEERGDEVADVSAHKRHGRIVNHGTWMIGGPSFRADIPRFANYHPATDPNRGHGLRLASDDLYDCRWEVRHQYQIPPDSKPGFYAARFLYSYEGKACVYHTTFVVKRGSDQPRAEMLVLAATNTWRAYNTNPFPLPLVEFKYPISRQAPVRGTPAFSLYRRHAAGQGSYQVGMRMPMPAGGPYVTYGEDLNYSHLARAERPLHIWLERQGYEFDLAADQDLHLRPDMLDGYKALVLVGHSEYWSAEMYQAVERFLARGGKLVCLSGNTMFWRVSFNDDASIMECRKVDAPGAHVDGQLRGERWHSQDRKIGGLMRETGFSEVNLIGVATLGWNNVRIGQAGPYVVQNASTLFFASKALALKEGDVFGDGANGHEFDAVPSRIAAIQVEAAPAGAPPVPPDPKGITVIAHGLTRKSELGGSGLDWYGRNVPLTDNLGGEIVWWERPAGGTVFTIGSIGAAASLLRDKTMQSLVQNALSRFGIEPNPALAIRPAPADFDQNLTVDLDDFFLFAAAFGTARDGLGWDPRFDLDGSGQVDLLDFFLFADAFGK